MRPKGMEDLAAFSAREVKRAAAEERERDEYFSAIEVPQNKEISEIPDEEIPERREEMMCVRNRNRPKQV